MAQFTQSIREILFENAGQDNPMTIEGMTAIAKRVLFGEEINVIDSEYRDRLVSGFCLHYFNDEIGYETLPMWRFALKEKMYNNAEFINLTFGYLDKQIFADYRVRKLNTAGTKSDNVSVITDGNIKSNDSSASVKENTGTSADAHTGSQTSSATGNDMNQHTGTVDRVRTAEGVSERGGSDTATANINENRSSSGSDTAKRTGTSAMEHAGVATQKNTGSDESRTVGADVATKTGTVGTEHEYTSDTVNGGVTKTHGGDYISETTGNTRSESGSYTDTMDGRSNDSVDNNAIGITYDTPMGSLSNMRTPDTSLRGEGVGAAAGSTGSITPPGDPTHTRSTGGRDYNYMSGASEQDASSLSSGNEHSETTRSFNDYTIGDTGSRTVDATGSAVETDSSGATNVQGADGNETTYNTQDSLSRDMRNTMTHDTQSQNISSGSDVRTDDLQDERNSQAAQTVVGNNATTTEYNSNQTNKSNESGADIFNDQNTVTRNASNATEFDDTVTRTDNLSEKVESAKAGNVKTDTTEATEGQHAHVEDTKEETATFNYELYMKAEPMMSKLWTVFDDLFIMIIDAF